MISTEAIRKACTALNATFNAEQVSSLIVAVEHLLDGYVRQITGGPDLPEPSDEVEQPVEVGDTLPVERAATTKKAK